MKTIKQLLTFHNTDSLLKTSPIFILTTRLLKPETKIRPTFLYRGYLKRHPLLSSLARFAACLCPFTCNTDFYAFLRVKNQLRSLQNFIAISYYEWIFMASFPNILFFNFLIIYTQIFNFLIFPKTWGSICLK